MLISSLLVAVWVANPAGLTVEQCVQIALENNARIEEAQAKVEEFEARLAEVQSIFYPKLWGLGFVAPMFSVDFNATEEVAA